MQLDGPWALRLDVGRPTGRDLLDGAELDNYAFPLASRLEQSRSDVGVVHEAVQRAVVVRIDAAREMPPPSTDVLVARPTASCEKPAYKEQIHAVVADAAELPDGSIRRELAFLVGPGRKSWHLWKPTIDSLPTNWRYNSGYKSSRMGATFIRNCLWINGLAGGTARAPRARRP